eukprot:gnl/TRDRNA2_/TRDRNA2_173017_c0_seq1.p1 gnl/TRDRNA2_/TRDRNA2_173017_c0~~gnl/TRDRNA2_/TRDRNA2_173017_c0_seq1.p1  ORF type:complete len:406 (-),score=78.75 gnl/TRDRNA2_/TRDRNA2_173017_c0_seq1:30-1247(-)
MAQLHTVLLITICCIASGAEVASDDTCAAGRQDCQKPSLGPDESALVQKTIAIHSSAAGSKATEEDLKLDTSAKSDSEAQITPPRLPVGQMLMGKKELMVNKTDVPHVEADIKTLLEDVRKAQKVFSAQSTCARKKVMTGFQALNGPVVNKLHDMQIQHWLSWHDLEKLMGNAIMKGVDDILAAYERGEKWDKVQSAAITDATLQYPQLESNLMIESRRLWNVIIQGVGYEWGRVSVLNEKEHPDLLCSKVWDPLIETRVATFNLWNTTSVLLSALQHVMPLSAEGKEDNSWETLSPREQHRLMEIASSQRMDPDLPLAARIQAIAGMMETLSGYLEVGQMSAAVKVEICVRPPTDFDPAGAYEMEDVCTDEVVEMQWGKQSGASSLRFGLGLVMAAMAMLASWF